MGIITVHSVSFAGELGATCTLSPIHIDISVFLSVVMVQSGKAART